MVAHPVEGLIIYIIVNCRTEEKLTEENAKKRSDEGIIVISAILFVVLAVLATLLRFRESSLRKGGGLTGLTL